MLTSSGLGDWCGQLTVAAARFLVADARRLAGCEALKVANLPSVVCTPSGCDMVVGGRRIGKRGRIGWFVWGAVDSLDDGWDRVKTDGQG
jgi:hypothetical protein